jgi:phosphatidylglycerophosphate synthase
VTDDLYSAGSSAGHKRSILKQSDAASDPTPRANGTAARSLLTKPTGLIAQIPNVLSAMRIAAAAAWIALASSGYAGQFVFAALAVGAAATDIIDGRVARRLGVAGVAGRWLDGVADVTFVLAALVCEASRGAIPFYIPILIAISFAQYAIDSILLAKSTAGPVRSRLGHWGGIVNYALVIALGIAPTLASAMIRGFAPILALFYFSAIAERALGYRGRTPAA